MGLTNFHSPTQMLDRAGSAMSIQAMIQEFGCRVYVNYTSFPREVIQKYSWRLNYCHLDQWASPDYDSDIQGRGPVTNTKTPDPIKIPKICISPCLKTPPYDDELSKKFDYIFLVEGSRGANLKLILLHTHQDAGVALFHEAMNGYSVVFSGVVMKKVFKLSLIEPRSRLWELRFRKAESVEELLKQPVDFDDYSRGLTFETCAKVEELEACDVDTTVVLKALDDRVTLAFNDIDEDEDVETPLTGLELLDGLTVESEDEEDKVKVEAGNIGVEITEESDEVIEITIVETGFDAAAEVMILEDVVGSKDFRCFRGGGAA